MQIVILSILFLRFSSFDLGIYRVSERKHAFVLIMRFVKRYFKVAESVFWGNDLLEELV